MKKIQNIVGHFQHLTLRSQYAAISSQKNWSLDHPGSEYALPYHNFQKRGLAVYKSEIFGTEVCL